MSGTREREEEQAERDAEFWADTFTDPRAIAKPDDPYEEVPCCVCGVLIWALPTSDRCCRSCESMDPFWNMR